ncbi:MAG TPA: hypothetical protein VL588_12950 [Bdellovibrionota bacterium]|jgi:hypothetical protein|nr:hypothetical protein [Bdellovibrionota bacterium]
MNRDDFLHGLREQYAEEIQAAYQECCHENGKVVDFTALHGRLNKLQKSAKVEGLPENDFSDLVSSALPDLAAKLKVA